MIHLLQLEILYFTHLDAVERFKQVLLNHACCALRRIDTVKAMNPRGVRHDILTAERTAVMTVGNEAVVTQ